MVYVTMPYVVMAYVVMAYIVMAYVVMALYSYGLYSYGRYSYDFVIKKTRNGEWSAHGQHMPLHMSTHVSIKMAIHTP